MKRHTPAWVVSGMLVFGAVSWAGASPAAPPALPELVSGHAGVKTYLLGTLKGVNQAAADLKSTGAAYAKLCAEHGGAEAAAKADPAAVAALVTAMRDAYQRIDSYGYEYVEGVVAGVPSLEKYDVELDSGLPAKDAGPDDAIAEIMIDAGDLKLDREGSLNNFLIEPTVFGTNDRFIAARAALPRFDKPVGLPHPKLVEALGDYAIDGYARLTRDSEAWQPSDADLFQVLENMTPTLADYFEEWKQAKTHGGAASGGRFVAVSRVSDMRGIMGSVRLTWMALEPQVRSRDAALAKNISEGYRQIMAFIDTADEREVKEDLGAEAIDALGSQAKEKADKLTVQATQAAALLGVATANG